MSIALAACGGDGGSPPAGPEEPDPTPVVSTIELRPPERTIGILGHSFSVRALALSADGEMLYGSYLDPGRFSWSSSAPDIATLGEETHPITGRAVRLVTGVSEGTATITATSDGLTGSMKVTVRDRARVAWSLPIPTGPINGGNVIGADGTIYVGTSDPATDRTLWYAVSPEDGILWTLDLPFTGRSIPAIGTDGTIYIGSRTGSGATGFTGRLIAVDPRGTVRWMLEDLDGIRSAPAIGQDGTIYVAGGHHVYAVEPQGEIQWTYEADDDAFVFSSPAIARDGTIYVGGADHLLYAINPDGSLKWTFETRGIIQSSPSIGLEGTVHFGSMDGRLYSIDPDGTERWSVELDWRGISSSPSIASDGTIYIGAGGVFAVDPGGSVRWNYAPSAWFGTTPILGADGTAYVAAGGGVTALDAQGRLLWDYQAGSPVIGLDGTIIAAAGHELVTILEHAPTNGGYAGAPWPQARGDRANSGRAGG